MASNTTRLRFAILASTLLFNIVRSAILMFGLFYVTPLYPLFAALSSIGLIAAFGIRLGIEFDPMMILLGGLINIIDREITIGKNTWSFVIWALNFAFAFVGSIVGGLLFIALNSNVTIPAALVPQQVLPGGWWVGLFATILFTLPVCVIFALINVYSRDGHASIPNRFGSQLAIGSIFFFVGRDVADYGLTWATYLAAQNFGSVADGFTLFFGWIISIGLTLGLYYLFYYPVANKITKKLDSRGDAVVLDHLIGFADIDECTVQALDRAKAMVRREMKAKGADVESGGRRKKNGMAVL